jgi:LAS superfamily LD-carboxypeptidase LdcB
MTSYPVKKCVPPARVKQAGCGTLPANMRTKLNGSSGTMFSPAARWFNRMYNDAAAAGFTLQVVGQYRTLATMRRLFLDRYSPKPTGRTPQVTRRYQGKTWYLKKGKSPVATPPEGTPPNQRGGSMHGYGIAVDINVSDPRLLRWLRRNAPNYGFYWQGQPTRPNGTANPEWEPWHLNWCGRPDTE